MATADLLGINATRLAVLLWIAGHPNTTLSATRLALDIPHETARGHLYDLTSKGAVRAQIHRGRATTYVCNQAMIRNELVVLSELFNDALNSAADSEQGASDGGANP